MANLTGAAQPLTGGVVPLRLAEPPLTLAERPLGFGNWPLMLVEVPLGLGMNPLGLAAAGLNLGERRRRLRQARQKLFLAPAELRIRGIANSRNCKLDGRRWPAIFHKKDCHLIKPCSGKVKVIFERCVRAHLIFLPAELVCPQPGGLTEGSRGLRHLAPAGCRHPRKIRARSRPRRGRRKSGIHSGCRCLKTLSGGIAGRSTPGYLLASLRDAATGASNKHCKKVVRCNLVAQASCLCVGFLT